MAFYMSPLVDINEIDLTTTIPAVSTSVACLVLRNTYKGSEMKKKLITNVNELIDEFGEPITTLYNTGGTTTTTDNCYQDMLAAQGYLKYGRVLYCTRTLPTSATFAGTKAVDGINPTFAQFTGATGDHVSYTLSDFASDDPDEFHNDITVSTHKAYFIANSRGYWGNNIRIATITRTTYNEILSGGHLNDSNWTVADTVYNYVDGKPESDEEFVVIVQVKDQGETTWSNKEIWVVSTNERKLDDQGSTMYAEHLINSQSKYIRIAFNATQKNADWEITTRTWQQFAGGYDYNSNESATPSDADIIIGYELYQNAEEVDMNLIIDSNKSLTVKQEIIDICESRKDCMAVLDCLYSDIYNQSGSEVTNLRDWRNNTLAENTSYAALYGNWLNVYDKWNQTYRWIPASGHVAGIMANTDEVSDPWFAPAGLNRAVLSNVRKLAWNPTSGERDVLYKNGINPIVSFASLGKVVWGQKTLLDKSSAFNRINVRRLFLVLEKAVSTASRYFLFEQNDDVTRLQLINMIDPYLRDVKGRRGIYDFLIVCDETNNTAERIDRNELWVDIYVKPTRAAEYIVLNFIATKTGASFTEIASTTNTLLT